jgi:ATP-dependent DNA helicase PIF1
MLIKNLDDDLVNGSIGIVMGFFSESESAIRAVSDWEDGSPNDPEPITPAAAAVAKRKAAAEGGAGYVQRWPLIRFSLPGGGYREQLIMPEEFKIDEADGTVKAAREQLPLIRESDSFSLAP